MKKIYFNTQLSSKLTLSILENDKQLTNFFFSNKWLDITAFSKICTRYGFPKKQLSIVIEDFYIDPIYRDIYYNYWARFHYDWPRSCRRIFLFQNCHYEDDFFNERTSIQDDFLGTIVVRPAYSSSTDVIETDHTFGLTLLDPYKMITTDSEGHDYNPFVYLETTEYRFHLLGHILKIRAFPFLSQDGVAIKCAETAICTLCNFEAHFSSLYSTILPSDIQNKLKEILPERVLPSHGLYCSDISYLLREFGFSTMIYADTDNKELAKENDQDFRIGVIMETSLDNNDLTSQSENFWDTEHVTDLKKWLHYYVDSAIPILIITAPNKMVNRHATLVVGHSIHRKKIKDCRVYKLGEFDCIDTADLYEEYIIQDDNQVPYVLEKYNRFTQNGNYKLEAFIVPLEKHVFLEAASAISIFDAFISHQHEIFMEAICGIINTCKDLMISTECEETKNEYLQIIQSMEIDRENPITIRYHLANSAEYKRYRISTGDTIKDKKFYADIMMPKSVWIAEISSFKCYEMELAFAELVLDATAANQSKVNSIILFRVAQLGVYRQPDETYNVFRKKLENNSGCTDLSAFFPLYGNFL